MTNQEIFDRVCKHLADQGGPAMDHKGVCKYRGPKGTKCAVGCLIPDEIYNSRMENVGVNTR